MRTSRWITSTLVAAFGLVTAAVAQTPAPTVETAAQRVERFLTAMGGRAAWAAVAFVHVEAVHYDLVFDHPFTNRIWNDFSRPRVRFEAKNEQIDRRRGVLDGKGWRLRDGVASKLTAEEVESDRAWWEANIYRTLHRLAVGDPDLSARATGERRLEVFRADGRRLNWFELNTTGEPIRFGTWDSEDGGVFGPLASNGSVRYPKWGTQPDGSWRYEVVRLVSAAAVPAEVSFEVP